MRFILFGLLLIPIQLLSQQKESWNTINVCTEITKKTWLVTEAEQRYNLTNDYVRYFHYDIGYLTKVSQKVKIGLYYREVYEMKNNYRIQESRPHVDFFYDTKSWKHRVRIEYQIRERLEDMTRFRYRPTYSPTFFKNFNPYVGDEILFSKYGFTRNRFNVGITYKHGPIEIQPSYMLESVGGYSIVPIKLTKPWSHKDILWINFKIKL